MLPRNHPLFNSRATIMEILTKNKYFVKVPRIYLYSPEELKYFGMHTTEINGRFDKKSSLELTDSYKSLLEIADIINDGMPVLVKEPVKYIPNIYEKLTEVIDILKNTPFPNEEEREELLFKLEIALEKIVKENGEYIGKIINDNDRYTNYTKQRFGKFMTPRSIEHKVKIDNNNTPTDTNKGLNRRYGMYKLNLDDIEG